MDKGLYTHFKDSLHLLHLFVIFFRTVQPKTKKHTKAAGHPVETHIKSQKWIVFFSKEFPISTH